MFIRDAWGFSAMEFIFTKPALICQDDGGAIAMCKSDKRHSRRGQVFVHVNVHIARDAYNQRACCYPWVPIKYNKGDIVNKQWSSTCRLRTFGHR